MIQSHEDINNGKGDDNVSHGFKPLTVALLTNLVGNPRHAVSLVRFHALMVHLLRSACQPLALSFRRWLNCIRLRKNEPRRAQNFQLFFDSLEGERSAVVTSSEPAHVVMV